MVDNSDLLIRKVNIFLPLGIKVGQEIKDINRIYQIQQNKIASERIATYYGEIDLERRNENIKYRRKKKT